jgi:putative spermidine/putrescine transport system permease protein
MHGVFLVGFENSIKLGLLSAIIPGVLGVFLAYAIQTSNSNILRRLCATASGVLANFSGINLTFIFIATLGSTGVLTYWLQDVGIKLTSIGFNLYTFSGVLVVHMYFQLPLMVLVITPALGGLRASEDCVRGAVRGHFESSSRGGDGSRGGSLWSALPSAQR